MLAISALWWAALHIAAAAGIAVRWSLPPSIGHGVLMTFGFMPMFFAGFVFTAGPKWLNRPSVRASTLLAPVAAQLSGWAVFMMAAHGADAAFARGSARSASVPSRSAGSASCCASSACFEAAR